MVLISLVAASATGCQPGTSGLPVDPVAASAPLQLTLVPVYPAPPDTDLPALFQVQLGDPATGAPLKVELPLVIGALALPGGRSVAFVSPDRGLFTWTADGRVRLIDSDVLPQLSASPGGRLLVYPRQPTAGGALWLADLSGGRRWRLSPGGAAAGPLFGPSGDRVVYVDTSPEGIAALFVVRLDPPGAPRQLTNLGLRRTPGRPPAGFVPPPEETDRPSWRGDTLDYRARGRGWHVQLAEDRR